MTRELIQSTSKVGGAVGQDLAGVGRQQRKLAMFLTPLVVLLAGSLYGLYPVERSDCQGGVA